MKITNGEKIIIVSRGAFNEHYKGNGWVECSNTVSDGEKPETKRDLTEIPLSEMKADELKAYAKLQGIDISKVTKKEDILKTIQEAKLAEESAGDGGSQ